MVTSRASDDNLIDDQGARTSDIMAPPRQSRSKQSAKPAPAASDETASDGTAGGGVSPNGTPAGGREEAPANGTATDKARPAVDDTVVDGVPALPADTIGSSRAAQPAVEDPTIAYSPTPAMKPGSDDPVAPGALLVGRFRRDDWFRRAGGRPPGAGRAAVGLRGRVRVGDA